MIKRALISVSDKTGAIEFAKNLDGLGIEIISTGGTAKALGDAGIKVVNVSDITGFPECLNGRVKTLHPKIHGGLLAVRDNAEHMRQLKELGIDTIDMVVINLYPFKQTIMKPGVTLEEAIENIDIGGPTMLRSAAKNYQDITVIVDPGDYQRVLEEIRSNGDTGEETKYSLALKVFEHTGQYDAMIAGYLRESKGLDEFPQKLTVTFEKIQDMRYGENPHQAAAFYKEVLPVKGSIAQAVQLHGKELSFNNINDTNGALDLLREFEEPAIVGVKHANPCGVGSADNIYDAYMKAYEADPVSIFGGIIASNREIDERTAVQINKIFIEIVIAPSFSPEALKILKAKKNIRLLQLAEIAAKLPDTAMDMKKVGGGLLVQNIDNTLIDMDCLEVVTKRRPTDKEMEDLIFAWKVVKHTKSNGIAICKDKQSLGIGPGQVNRIWATTQAVERSGQRVKGAVLASDAFFPFPDNVEAAGKAGVTAIIQPGGSLKDNLSIEKADEFGIAMVFTKIRHFKH